MGQIKWYKRDPSAALNGMMELDLQERGAYNTVLDLIYSRDGNLPDDDRFIAGWLRVDVRVWKRIKATLIDREKLYVEGGHLRNERADVEVLAALSRVTSAADAGRASARSKAYKSDDVRRENNDLGSTSAPTGVPTTVSTSHNHNQKEEEPYGSPSLPPTPKKAKAKRSVCVDHQLPEGWSPSLTERTTSMTANWPPGMLEREEFTFRNHAAANGRLAKNWDAAFAMWLSKADERLIGNGYGNRQGQPPRNNRSSDEPLNPFVRAAAERQAERAAHGEGQSGGWPDHSDGFEGMAGGAPD